MKLKCSKKQFLIFTSIIVGLTAGLAAVILKSTVFYIHRLVSLTSNIRYQNYFFLALPTVGILLTLIIVKFFLKDKFKKGTGQVLYSIAKNSSIIERETAYSQLITSAITVGLGGSAGLEAPIVISGAAIGSNYGRVNRIDYKGRTLLLACGSAAGIAAVFNSPIAGIMFAFEVILSDASISTFIPLIFSAVTGALCSKIILQESILLSFKLQQPFNYFNVPYYLILGVLAGIVSIYYANMNLMIERFAQRFNKNIFIKATVGGLFIGLLVFVFPPLFGEGYISIIQLASGNSGDLLNNSIFYFLRNNEWFILFFVGIIALTKVIATSFTLSFGGNGGNFAPSLFVGAFLGFFFSKLLNLLNIQALPISNFTIVGMAGILSGVMYAPLTGIFLIAEITGGYELMIPLMIVASISYGIVKAFHPFSMDTRGLAELGHILTDDKDKNILTLLDLKEIIETDFSKIYIDQNIKDLKDIISHSKRNLFPVVTREEKLMGIVYIENIREIMFELPELGILPVIELMTNPPAVIEYREDMKVVMRKLDECNVWNLPVVNNGEYIGFISKSSFLNKYREKIKLY